MTTVKEVTEEETLDAIMRLQDKDLDLHDPDVGVLIRAYQQITQCPLCKARMQHVCGGTCERDD